MKKILWIEDETYIIKYVVSPLKREGYSFEIAESYDDFVEHKSRLNEYSLILLDLILPEKNGGPPFDDVGRKILEEINSENLIIPIVIFTVIDENGLNAQLESTRNVCAVLHKPISSKELLSVVKDIDKNG